VSAFIADRMNRSQHRVEIPEKPDLAGAVRRKAPVPDFRVLFESAPGLYLVLLPDEPTFTIVAVSNAYAAATMVKREDILGRGLFEIFPDNPDDPETTGVQNLHASLRRALESGTPDTMAIQKYDIRRPDGIFEERYWAPVNSAVLDENGRVHYLIHRVQDVTEFVRLKLRESEQANLSSELRSRANRIEAELFLQGQELADAKRLAADLERSHKALRKSEFRYRRLFESARDGILIVNGEGRFVEVNDSFCRILKTTRERLLDAHFSEFVPPESASDVQRAFLKLRNDWNTPIEFPFRALDGSIVELEWTSSSKYLPGLYFCACRDITERKSLQATSLRVAAIVESSVDAIVGEDLDGTIVSWNRGAERIFGYKAQEVLGRHISLLATPDGFDEMAGILKRIGGGEHVDHFETKRRRKDGQIIDVSLTVSPVRDGSGRIIGASKIARDVTERERTAQALRATNAALSRANADLEQVAYSASHDLQEPLRIVAVYSEMLKKKYGGRLDRQADEYIGYTVDGARRMQQLLRDLLACLRATDGGDAQVVRVDASEAIGHAIANLHAAIEESGASITYTGLPRVMVDPVHLQQIFQNLIGNAIKYRSNERPCISVKATRRNKEWLFAVKDNGIGIQEEHADQIFGVFKRLHPSGPHTGTGIGLAICERLVRRYGGSIWVESSPGRGATFFFTMPDSTT